MMDHCNQRNLYDDEESIPYPLQYNDPHESKWQPKVPNERNIAGFVSKLYQCLQAPDDGHKYAYWCKHNGVDMFVIHSIPKFTEIVLPRLFKHCKFTSFVRQLNIYGFQRDTDARKSKDVKDKKTCRWHHVYFRPNRRDLFHLIRRQTPGYVRRRELQSRMIDSETVLGLEPEDEKNFLYDDYAQSMNERNYYSDSSKISPTITHYGQPQNGDDLNDSISYAPDLHELGHPELQRSYYSFSNQPMYEHSPTPFQHASPSILPPPDYNTKAKLPIDRRTHYGNEMHMHNRGSLHTESSVEEEHHYVIQSLTGELKKAQSLIAIQKSRIQCLESNLLQYEQQLGSNNNSSASMSNSSSIGSNLNLYSSSDEFMSSLGKSPFVPLPYSGMPYHPTRQQNYPSFMDSYSPDSLPYTEKNVGMSFRDKLLSPSHASQMNALATSSSIITNDFTSMNSHGLLDRRNALFQEE
ncbi:HSF-type DNA-binding-domain-containing protein [Choanephora cucurbitarum]|nr:HSF-type DNA-binding-domain-containing protein [Choanephora cucurbitarum]